MPLAWGSGRHHIQDNSGVGISQYIREIGRGKDGARALTREQATDLFGQVLDGQVSDLEVGGFCLSMRIKGETPEELAGFLDATEARLLRLPEARVPTVVLPSYNGARKLPVLTPLLGLLLARRGVRVLNHGQTQDPGRVTSHEVIDVLRHDDALGHLFATSPEGPGLHFLPTHSLHAGLQRLLDVRRVVGLRNPAHSVVKLMLPCAGPALLVSSYTHPEYLHSMGQTLERLGRHALLLRGTEGEPVADPRRMPAMQAFEAGERTLLQEAQHGTLASLPALPGGHDASTTADHIRAILAGRTPVPASLARQVECILQMLRPAAAGQASRKEA